MAAQVVETVEIFSNDLAGTSFLTGCQCRMNIPDSTDEYAISNPFGFDMTPENPI
jgi:hypothetical protein